MKIKRTEEGLLLFNREDGLHILKENHELSDEEKKIPINTFPEQFNISLTKRCNLLCKSCYASTVPDGNDFYTKNDILNLLKIIDELGSYEATFGGGEPLLFKDFDKLIIEGYNNTRIAMNFTTNGTLITQQFLDKIKGHVGSIRVSIDGVGGVFKKIRGNVWNQVEKGISLLKENGFRFGFNTMLCSVNFEDYANILDYADKVSCNNVLFTPFRPYGRGEKHKEMLTTKEQLKIFSKFLQRVKGEYKNMEILIDSSLIQFMNNNGLPILPTRNLSGCGAGRYFVSLTEDGFLKKCSFSDNSIMFLGKSFEKLKEWKSLKNNGCECWDKYYQLPPFKIGGL